jgi:hypothetical protein
MPTVRVPLVGTYNQRGLSGSAALTLSQDQQFKNAIFSVNTNPVTGKSVVYVEKRPGWGQDSVVTSSAASTGLIQPQSFSAILTAFGETNSTIYLGTISVGVITGRALHFTETLISSVGCVAIKSSDGTGWYYMDGAKDDLTYVGDTHNGTAVIDSLDSTTGIYPGQAWSGTGVPAGTRVLSVDSAVQITLNANCTADGTDITFTKTPIAKILDAQFVTTGTYIGAFGALDGYLFYPTDDGYVNNSDLNSVSAYSANARIAVQQSPDPSIGIAIQKSHVVVFGRNSSEKFQNAGFSSGSPLQVLKQQVEHIGALDQRSITTIDDDTYYVSTPSEGDVGVYRMRGLSSTKVSTPREDRIIGTFAVDGAIYANSFKLGGQTYATFDLSTASDGPASYLLQENGDKLLLESGDDILLEDTAAQTASFVRKMVYNATLNIWGEWDCNQCTFIDSVGSGTANKLIATSRFSTDGKVYRIDPVSDGELYRDDGSSYSLVIRTAGLDFGTGRRKFIPRIKLICDKVSTGTALLEASDDDFGSWVTIGTFDLTSMEPELNRCGSHVGKRAYRLTHSTNGPFRGEALEIDYEISA